MSLPPLNDWMDTVLGLHRAALLLGVVQRLTQPPQPAYLELSLRATPAGLSGGPLPGGGRLLLDLAGGRLLLSSPGAAEQAFPIAGRTQAELFEALFACLAEGELAAHLPPGESSFERAAAGVAARGGRYKPLSAESLLDPDPIRLDPEKAQAYSLALQAAFNGLARFRAGLLGMMTPLVVWPEHFDLATLWFLGGEINEDRPHLSFGFAPYSPGIEEAYFYAYAYPYPARYQPPALPEGARWHTQGWTGMVLPYNTLAASPNPAQAIEAAFTRVHASLLPLIAP